MIREWYQRVSQTFPACVLSERCCNSSYVSCDEFWLESSFINQISGDLISCCLRPFRSWITSSSLVEGDQCQTLTRFRLLSEPPLVSQVSPGLLIYSQSAWHAADTCIQICVLLCVCVCVGGFRLLAGWVCIAFPQKSIKPVNGPSICKAQIDPAAVGLEVSWGCGGWVWWVTVLVLASVNLDITAHHLPLTSWNRGGLLAFAVSRKSATP